MRGTTMNKILIIDGDKFSDFKGFCKEFSDIFLSGTYKWHGNLDALNDLLFGGFGDIETEEQFTIIWRNSAKSKVDLGYSETIVKLNEKLNNCHQSYEEEVIQEIKDAKMNKGPTIFDEIEEIILENENVTLILE